MHMETNSARAFAQAQQVIPGGVNSPARAFGAVGGGPLFIERGAGSRIFDVDGREYIDYVCSWGPLIFGHAHPRVVQAVQEVSAKGPVSVPLPSWKSRWPSALWRWYPLSRWCEW